MHDAQRRIDQIVARLRKPDDTLLPADIDTGGQPTIDYQSNFTPAEFEEAVREVRGVHSRRRYLSGRAQPAAAS